MVGPSLLRYRPIVAAIVPSAIMIESDDSIFLIILILDNIKIIVAMAIDYVSVAAAFITSHWYCTCNH